MLIYESRVRKELVRILSYAESLRSKFAADVGTEELLRDTETLSALWESFFPMLPPGFDNISHLERHLAWMKRRLSEGAPEKCAQDIDDICRHDIPTVEANFNAWCESATHFDAELISKTSELVARREMDSAVRKAFVILTARMRSVFNIPDDIDGQELVNRALGRPTPSIAPLTDAERQGLRDLLAGLYALYRNKYAHDDVASKWHETDALISIINLVLKELDEFPGPGGTFSPAA